MANGDLEKIQKALAGWQSKGTGVFDHVNQTMRLSIESRADDGHVRAQILDKETEAGLTLIIEYGDKLDLVLAIFVKWKDTVNDETFRSLVGDLLKAKVRVLAETEDGLAEIDVE